jgi:hypothetical protein
MGHITNPVSASPVSDFFSTNLNSRITTFAKLAERIARTLGYPQVNIEAHQDQVMDNISIAIEMFSKFGGYTEEFLVFKSSLYERGKGLAIDKLFSITPELAATHTASPSGSSTTSTSSTAVSAGFDYDLDSYRKVIDVFSFEEGSTTGINTLFTLEQTLAQQTYFSYAMGKYGFDLVSWYTLKNWLDVRSTLLSQKHYFKFDSSQQRLYLTPEPGGPTRASFYGLIGAYVEKPVRELVKEVFVYQYALALTKITIGRIRGKYSGTALFGGGTLNHGELLSEGLSEKEKLETQLYEGAAGLGDAAPPMFFVG